MEVLCALAWGLSEQEFSELVEVLCALARGVSEQEFRQLSRDVPAMQAVCAIELPYSGS